MPRSIPEQPVSAKNVCYIISLPGLTPYAEALALQMRLLAARQQNQIRDTLVLLEHPPTITLGRGSHDVDLLTSEAELAQLGIAVERVDRGGEITYHAPGQLVGYPILDLREHGQDLHRYLRDLEETLIRALGVLGVNAGREPGLTGVWTGGSKIAAMGIKVSHWVTMHGFALNISPDLSPMRRDFVPCGIRDRGVTSLAECLPNTVWTRADVEPHVLRAFADVFQLHPHRAHQGILFA